MLAPRARAAGRGTQLIAGGDDRGAIGLKRVDPRGGEVVAIAPLLPALHAHVHARRRRVVDPRDPDAGIGRVAGGVFSLDHKLMRALARPPSC